MISTKSCAGSSLFGFKILDLSCFVSLMTILGGGGGGGGGGERVLGRHLTAQITQVHVLYKMGLVTRKPVFRGFRQSEIQTGLLS